MGRSEELFERAVKRIPGGVNSPVRAYGAIGMAPRFIKRADGCHIYDVDDNCYVDYIDSWGPMILGHNFPFYLHFKGGKGIAVSAAVIVASSSNTSLGWIMIGVFLAVFIIVVGITRYVSLGSLIVVWYFPLYVILEYHGIETSLFVIMLVIALIFTALAYFKHAGNIRRLMNHTERKLGEKKEKENE